MRLLHIEQLEDRLPLNGTKAMVTPELRQATAIRPAMVRVVNPQDVVRTEARQAGASVQSRSIASDQQPGMNPAAIQALNAVATPAVVGNAASRQAAPPTGNEGAPNGLVAATARTTSPFALEAMRSVTALNRPMPSVAEGASLSPRPAVLGEIASFVRGLDSTPRPTLTLVEQARLQPSLVAEAGVKLPVEPTPPGPQLAGLMPAGFNLDLTSLEQSLQQFLDQLDQAGQQLARAEDGHGWSLWLMAAAIAGVACDVARRQLHRPVPEYVPLGPGIVLDAERFS